MRRFYFFLFFFIVSLKTFSQIPHLSGIVVISLKKGTIRTDLTLSNVPPLENYALLLNTGFNFINIENSATKKQLHWEKAYKGEEGFEYLITSGEDTVKQLPSALHVQYTGAFPVYADTAKMFAYEDWKGNIAFDGRTMRMTEQSKWYPVIYDKKNDVLIDKYTYSITVVCEEGTSIYVNGDVPKTGRQNRFSSTTPVALLVFAGNYSFGQRAGIYFINTGLKEDETGLLSRWSNEMISFYSNKLNIPYGSRIFYLAATPVSKDNVWLFVTYPTIAMVGRQITMHDLFTKTAPKAVDTSNIAFLSHEIGHYYFGTLLKPNTELKMAFLEGFTEYLSLQFVKEKLGAAAYKTMIQKYIAAINAAHNITPLNRFRNESEATEVFKYRYVPLMLIALQKTIGEEKMWQWLRSVLQARNTATNYAFFKSSLLSAGVDAKTFQAFEDKFFNSERALSHLAEAVQP